jgi:hypothetical protein
MEQGLLNVLRYIEFVEVSNHYQLKIGLIAQKAGTYVISFIPRIIALNDISDCGQSANVSYFVAVPDRHWTLYMSHFPGQSGDVYTFEVADTE